MQFSCGRLASPAQGPAPATLLRSTATAAFCSAKLQFGCEPLPRPSPGGRRLPRSPRAYARGYGGGALGRHGVGGWGEVLLHPGDDEVGVFLVVAAGDDFGGVVFAVGGLEGVDGVLVLDGDVGEVLGAPDELDGAVEPFVEIEVVVAAGEVAALEGEAVEEVGVLGGEVPGGEAAAAEADHEDVVVVVLEVVLDPLDAVVEVGVVFAEVAVVDGGEEGGADDGEVVGAGELEPAFDFARAGAAVAVGGDEEGAVGDAGGWPDAHFVCGGAVADLDGLHVAVGREGGVGGGVGGDGR